MEEKSIFEQDDQFSSLVKSAKRKSLKRSIIVSSIVTIFILILLWAALYIAIYFMYKNMDTHVQVAYESNYFKGANTESGGTLYDHYFIAGTTTTSFYKQVGPHLIDWDTTKYFFTILGTDTRLQTNGAFGVGEKMYQNNQQLMAFHLPEQETTKNDLDYIMGLPDFYNIEVAVSFKKELPLETMWQQFPSAQWAWIIEDGLRNMKVEEKKRDDELKEEDGENSAHFNTDYSEVMEYSACGFPIYHNEYFTNNPAQSAQIYKDKANLMSSYEAKVISETIGDQPVEEWSIAGVVLTGKKADLLPYLQQDSVRTVRIGVIVPY